jgi:hypothetical protein
VDYDSQSAHILQAQTTAQDTSNVQGPSRLIGHNFSKTKFGLDWRSFRDAWYVIVSFSDLQASSQFGHDVFTKSWFKIGRKHYGITHF